MRRLQIRTPEVFVPLLDPARYKGAWGGRGSGKSHFFAESLIEKALLWPGTAGEGLRALSFREVQKSLKESAKFLIESKLQKFGIGEADGFRVYADRIETPGDGLIAFTGMQDHTADSVKSYEGFHVAWGEEMQSVQSRSLTMLRPTIRWEDPGRGLASEMWFSWNPQRPTDAVDQLMRGANAPSGARVVRANWRDNPWFPKILEQERIDCLANEPEKYGHIWEGEYTSVFEGAYFATHLNEASLAGRIGVVPRDPLLKVYAFWDLASTSSAADAVAIWIVQFVGDQIRVLDHYEAVGQDFAAHVYWMRSNKWADVVCILPHDGNKHDTVYAVTPAGYLREAGFTVDRVENQGRGAAMMRVDATRRIFNAFWFNEVTTKHGREALGWYHEKRDEKRGMGLGPEHDWASHSADAFGMIAIYKSSMVKTSDWSKPIRRTGTFTA